MGLAREMETGEEIMATKVTNRVFKQRITVAFAGARVFLDRDVGEGPEVKVIALKALKDQLLEQAEIEVAEQVGASTPVSDLPDMALDVFESGRTCVGVAVEVWGIT